MPVYKASQTMIQQIRKIAKEVFEKLKEVLFCRLSKIPPLKCFKKWSEKIIKNVVGEGNYAMERSESIAPGKKICSYFSTGQSDT